MKKTAQLRNLINSKDLDIIMEAHNGLSAKIVEEAGFKGIWASGLSISASLGVRDNNELSWTQVLDVIEFMSDATSIPILLDGDTGYGNFNNARRLVKKLEQRQIAGVCIEDKCFPKTNSFISGEKQPLADIEEFCGKIKAMKDSQQDDDFVVVSRVEAFIAGWGLKEAMTRAESYRRAGADAILIHSKRSDIVEIEAFIKEWAGRSPLVLVPTTYYSVPLDTFRELGVNLVIWANHNLRASVEAMQKTSRFLHQHQNLADINDQIVPVAEIFRLQNAAELKDAELRYLPTRKQADSALILAAEPINKGSEVSKALLEVNGTSILTNQLDILTRRGVKNLWVVRGVAKDKIIPTNFKVIDNPQFNHSGSLYSLYLARDVIKGSTIITNGDAIYKDYIVEELLRSEYDITLVVDADTDTEGDFVITTTPYSKKLFNGTVELVEMSKEYKPGVTGQFTGLWKVSPLGANLVNKVLTKLVEDRNFSDLTLVDLFNELCAVHPVMVQYIKGSWLDYKNISSLNQTGD